MPELRLKNSIVDDRYLIERCLGRGSYAEIFLAYDQTRNGEPVIIKALNTSLQGTPDTDLDLTLVENFQNEAIALDKVRHSNIIRRLGHGTAADLEGVPFHYLVLEYMPGGDLLSLCRKRPLTLEETLRCFEQVAEALAYAHSKQVIHRDIKPNNLLLSADHSVAKIADFGVAKMTPDDGAEITRVGTNVYAPPEHHPDSPAESLNEKLTPSADVYSLAKTIYTAMTGRAPRQFARQPIIELPAELAREPWSDELLAVLNKATATRVAHRYQSVQQFWEDFARLPLADEIDEATIVRSRLVSAGAVDKAAVQPNFQSLTSAPLESAHPQKARIIVQLPQRAPVSVGQQVSVQQGNGTGSRVIEGDLANIARVEVAGQAGIAARGTSNVRAKSVGADVRAERSFFESLRAVIGSEWLRRAFIIFLIAALVGLAISTYYHFSGKKVALPFGSSLQYKTGTVVDDRDLNLRSEPNGDVLTTLPRTTRVKVFESRNGWSRVEVIEWGGPKPDDAPEIGWVMSKYVKLD